MNRAPSAFQIQQALSAWMSARSRLLAEDTDLAHDEASLSSLLGPEEGEVSDILARVLRAARQASRMADDAGDMIADIRARQDRFKRRAEAFKMTAYAIMEAIDQRKIELPDLTASIRAGTVSAQIIDDTALPDEYIRIERKPDKAAILADLKQGVVIEGAELTNGMPSLAIRSK